MSLPATPGASGLKGTANQFQRAIALQRQGQLAQAEALYKRILRSESRHAGALHLLGMIALQKGDARRALELISKSVASNPARAEPYADLGSAQHALGMTAEALASYDIALRLKPGLVAALYNRASLLQELDRSAEALEIYDHVIELQPYFAGAHYNRALVLSSLGRKEEALAGFDQALKIAPDYLEALSNRGTILLEMKRTDEALACFEQVLRLDPRSIQALNNRGNALRSQHRPADALVSFDRALELDPVFFEAHRNRGGTLRELERPLEALASFEAALRLRPDCSATLLDRAEVLIDLKRFPEATACLSRLLEVDPHVDYARGLRLHLELLECDWDRYEERKLELVEATRADERADYPLPFLAVSDSAAAQLRCARAFALDKYAVAPKPMWNGERYGHEKIRVAYVSGDLRNHAVSCLLAGVFELHDRERFEIIAISLRPQEQSPMGQRVRGAFDQFFDVSDRSDREIATLVKELEVDIAVDLMGFTKGLRTGALAYKPAPVQVNYLGFPGTMGAPYIDYLLADEFVIPPQYREHYAEKIVYLPECFQANDDRRAIAGDAPVRSALSLPEAGVVFCCFNNTYKLNPRCFDVWMRVLRAVPVGVLWLLAETPVIENNLRRAAQDRGVDPQRLIFAGRASYAEHLARLQCADLFLDTLPFNAGTTASDALWSGLPVLTCAGEAFAARMAGSLLAALGLPELVTHSLEEYEAVALKLGTAPVLLAELRAKLAARRSNSPVFNTSRFCRHLESAYASMWQRAERGEAPGSFAVPRTS
jgi:protein O-GlcNAc transferase